MVSHQVEIKLNRYSFITIYVASNSEEVNRRLFKKIKELLHEISIRTVIEQPITITLDKFKKHGVLINLLINAIIVLYSSFYDIYN